MIETPTSDRALVGYENVAGSVRVGWIREGDGCIVDISDIRSFWAHPADEIAKGPTRAEVALADVRLVPIVLPEAKVFCVGLNYRTHVAEGSYAGSVTEYPTIFGRWATSLSVSGSEVPVPEGEPGLDWEGEIAAFIGRDLYNVSNKEAYDAVVGYSVFNDITARTAQKRTSQWTVGKNADNSGVMGPLVPATDVGRIEQGLNIETRVNGTLMQRAVTADMIHTVGETLSLISQTLTIRSGDVLVTGTPAGVGYARTPPVFLHSGDEVEVSVTKLGSIRSFIVDR